MSNYNSKYQMRCTDSINRQHEITHTKEVSKAINSLNLSNNLWDVTWKGITFSVKPFLCSGLSFVGTYETFQLLCDWIIQYDSDFFNKLHDLTSTDFNNIFTTEENTIASCILYQFNSKAPCMIKYIIGMNNVSLIRKLIDLLMKDFMELSVSSDCYIHFKDKTICNTEAFSYFISVLWVLQKSKKLQILLSKELKTVNIKALLDDVCPECSLHYKYLSGEITASQLKEGYLHTDLYKKELYNLLFHDRSKVTDYDILAEVAAQIPTYKGFCGFADEMCSQYIKQRYYISDRKLYDNTKNELENIKKSDNILSIKYKELKSKAKALAKENASLQAKCSNNSNKDKASKFDKRLKELNSIISELKCELTKSISSIKEKDDIISKQKQLIRNQIKEIKSLKARLDEVSPVEVEKDEICKDIEPTTDISSMVEFLKDYKLGVFGGFNIDSIIEKFKTYGLEVKHIFDDDKFVVGDLDCAIVLVSNIKHKTVKHLKAQYNGRYVYVSGTSVKNMIQETYNLLQKEIEKEI